MAAASLCIVITIVSTLIGYAAVVDAVDMHLVSRICNGRNYPFSDSRLDKPANFVTSIASKTPADPNFDVYDHDDNFYGHASCSSKLQRSECADCMNSAYGEMFEECSKHGVGAQVKLRDCDLRYEEYYFGLAH